MTAGATNRVLYGSIALLFVCILAWRVALSAYVVRQLRYDDTAASRPFHLLMATGRLAAVSDAAQHAGLRAGDQLLAIANLPRQAAPDIQGGFQPFRGEAQVSEIVSGMHAGDELAVHVRHSPESAEATLSIPLEHRPRTGALSWASKVTMYILTPTFCMLLGFGVLAVRPRDRLAWLLLMLMLSFAQMSTGEMAYRAAWEW